MFMSISLNTTTRGDKILQAGFRKYTHMRREVILQAQANGC